MHSGRIATYLIVAGLLGIGGCAGSALEEQKRQEMEADIDDILSQELDPTDFGEPKTCLFKTEYRSFEALGDRHLLFRGRDDKLWVNFLRGRCSGLSRDSVFVMRPHTAGRLCDMDRFQVVDRINALSRAGMATTCILGEFKPVTEAQVEEVEKRLEMR